MDGLQVQERLRERGIDLPIVFLTGRGDIPMSVRALKAGARGLSDQAGRWSGPAAGDPRRATTRRGPADAKR
ncbi:MAG: hypothetical protein R3F44_09955 [Candidatus Competibacteraceae bacterium]